MNDILNESNIFCWVAVSPNVSGMRSVSGPLPSVCLDCGGHQTCARCGGSGGGPELPLRCTPCDGTGACHCARAALAGQEVGR